MSSFSIHQFSSGIRNPHQNREGKWVSGGYDQEIAKESYNVPQEIKYAVYTSSKGGWCGFGIPDAFPPQMSDFALIARELENYCVLAVANKQQDHANRLFIAYRYFWLDKLEFQNERHFSDFDGIATLLYSWRQTGNPQYNIREWANSPELYTTSWGQLKEYYTKTQFLQLKSTRTQPLISSIEQNNQSLSYNEPLIYEASKISPSLYPEEVHCLASQYSHVKKCSINWAWNVRRLENMQDLRVIYCADAEASNWFNQELSKRRPISNKSGEEVVKVSFSYPTAKNLETKEIRALFLKFRGKFSYENVLKMMDYYQEYKQSIVQFADEYIINYFLAEMPVRRAHNIKYVTLLTVLAPNRNRHILSELMKLNDKLKKEVAIKFLDELLMIATTSSNCFNHPIYRSLREKIIDVRSQLTSNLKNNLPVHNRFLPRTPFSLLIFFFSVKWCSDYMDLLATTKS